MPLATRYMCSGLPWGTAFGLSLVVSSRFVWVFLIFSAVALRGCQLSVSVLRVNSSPGSFQSLMQEFLFCIHLMDLRNFE
jgi:hypothetical protein